MPISSGRIQTSFLPYSLIRSSSGSSTTNSVDLTYHPTSYPNEFVTSGVSQNEPKPSLEALKDIFLDLTKFVPEAYRIILQKGIVTCTATKKQYDFKDLPKPSLFICDIFSPLVGQNIKEISPEIKLIHSFAPTVGSFIRHYGPPELGGLGNWEADTKAAMERGAGAGGKTFEEVADSLHTEHPGVLQPNPEGVQLYDYEMHPQDLPQPPIVPILMASTRLVRLCLSLSFGGRSPAFALLQRLPFHFKHGLTKTSC